MKTDTALLRERADVETSSAEYARRFDGSVGRWFLDIQARTTLALLRPWPGVSVVDLGGGHGQLTGPLVAAGYGVTVYSSDPVCVERVRPWVDTGQARFAAGDLLQGPWPDGSFDAALAFRLLPHVTRWPELIAELCRLARRAVIVDYPTRRSVNAVAELLFGVKKGLERDTRPFTVFRDSEIEAAFARHGFVATARRPQYFLPMMLHRALRAARFSRAVEGAARGLGLSRVFGSPVILRLERSDGARS